MRERIGMYPTQVTGGVGAIASARAARTQAPTAGGLSAGCAGISRILDLACGLLAFEVVAGLAARLDLNALTRTPAPERKHAPREDEDQGAAIAPVAASRRTAAMLASMRAVLDRETARLGEDGLEGKAAVDQVALIVRTLEKIDQMERLALEDQARAASQTLSAEERARLRQTVRQLIIAAAERLAGERRQGDAESADMVSTTGAGSSADDDGC